jgi:glycosyltransferase involved in cell wall biosynthesis
MSTGAEFRSSRRVLFVVPAEGGPGKVAQQLIPHIEARGWQVDELCLSRQDTLALRAAARSWWSTREVRRRADLVHVELGMLDLACFWYALLSALSGSRVTITAHDAPTVVLHPAAAILPQRRRPLKTLTYRLLAPLFDRPLLNLLLGRVALAVVLSAEVVAPWRAAGAPERVVVIPLGADQRGEQGPPSAGAAVLTAGFQGPSKGLDVLLAAWEIVGPDSPLPLWIMGETTDETHGARIAALKSRSSTMTNPPAWLGKTSDAEWSSRIQAAAIMVLPYRRSNPASGPLVSALAEGRAIIMSDVMAARGVLVDGVNALVVPPGDAHSLAEALRRLLEDPPLRDRLGQAAEDTAERRFTWGAHADGLSAALSEALEA